MTKQFKVRWFDKRDGEGMVSGEAGTFYINAAGIPGKKTWYGSTACVFYTEGQIIEAEIVEEHDRGGYLRLITPGTFDQVKWDSLDHDRLAFRCDENGNALNGLFAQKRVDK